MDNNLQEKDTIDLRQEQDKKTILENLQKIPIIQIACERTGVNRSTYYRWRKSDEIFAKAADQAIHSGLGLMNDLAESGLIAQLRDQNMSAIAFWLKHRHKAYKNKVEISGSVKTKDLSVTEEQQEIINQALAIAAGSINSKQQKYDDNKPQTGGNNTKD